MKIGAGKVGKVGKVRVYALMRYSPTTRASPRTKCHSRGEVILFWEFGLVRSRNVGA